MFESSKTLNNSKNIKEKQVNKLGITYRETVKASELSIFPDLFSY